MPEIPSYPSLTTPAPGDETVYVDISDTSASSQGTVKKVTVASLGLAITGQYNIVEYGADPTGTANSATAIQAAVTAALASGQGTAEVYVPPGA